MLFLDTLASHNRQYTSKRTGASSRAHAINPGTVITTTHVHHKANQVMLASRAVAWCDFVVLH
jgi:hypothetical protein